MRVCHVTTFYPPYHFGGDAILTQAMCEALARNGHDVTVVHSVDAYRLHGTTVPAETPDPPNLRRIALESALGPLSLMAIQQSGRPMLLRRRLAEVLADDYDVVHFHNVSLVGGPGVLSMSHAPVTLYTPHDHWLICNTHVLWKDGRQPCDARTCVRCALRSGIPPQLWRLGRFTTQQLEHVDLILSPSAFTAQQLRGAGISRPIAVLPSFTASVLLPPPVRPLPPNAPLLYAGRLVRSKGIEALLAAIAPRRDLRLRVVGDGPLLPALRAQYASAAHITFAGPVTHDAMREEYAHARAVIVPSWGPEVFPLTVIEAMAAGTPVIVRRAGGSDEAVERTGGGLVYEHPDELVPLIDGLLRDPALEVTLAEHARQGVAQHFSESRWLCDYLAQIERVRAARATGALT